jgi:hypothetical protein
MHKWLMHDYLTAKVEQCNTTIYLEVCTLPTELARSRLKGGFLGIEKTSGYLCKYTDYDIDPG